MVSGRNLERHGEIHTEIKKALSGGVAVTEFKFIGTERAGAVAFVTIVNPARRNALSEAVLTELAQALRELGQEAESRVIVLRAEGPVFSSGHDLREVLAGDSEEVMQLFDICYDAMRAVREAPQIVIAQVQGIATAAGCQLVAACDLAVAADTAKFATPGVNIGLFCTTPAVFVSRAVSRKKAVEMLFTGDFISAEEALDQGLINRVAPAERLEAETLELAAAVARHHRETIRIGKRAFYEQINMSDFEALRYATEVIVRNSATEVANEGIHAFLDKRLPEWRKNAETTVDAAAKG